MDQTQKEAVRHAVLHYLAERPLLSFDYGQIRRGLARMRLCPDCQPSDQDVAEAVQLLAGKGFVVVTPDGLGATPYAQASAEGVTAWERFRLAVEGA